LRFISCLTVTLCLLSASPLLAVDALLDAGRCASIDFLLENAISHNLIAGGVVVVGNSKGVLFSTSKGRITSAPDSPPLNERTVFDIASLTKVFATTPAVMKLLEEGRITLMDPITRWFPEFEGTGREDITILNLLTHTSGLEDVSIPVEEPLKTAIQKVVKQKTWKQPGNRFRYADINFILLGELVQRATGVTLDRFCRENLYAPLEMSTTMFFPPLAMVTTIAPTLGPGRELIAGIVQDENARHMGGVAGHAGLFSSASDLALFVRMLLGGGVLDNKRILPERVVAQMTAPYFYNNGDVVRGLGWDIYSPFSSPKGSSFSEMSFGHTGYSGSSVWIDPQRDLFVILLTTRLDYRDTRLFNRLRNNISTLAAAAFSVIDKTEPPPMELPSP
jgi:CubicO group peptidase (beta-lactamase class C family)